MKIPLCQGAQFCEWFIEWHRKRVIFRDAEQKINTLQFNVLMDIKTLNAEMLQIVEIVSFSTFFSLNCVRSACFKND